MMYFDNLVGAFGDELTKIATKKIAGKLSSVPKWVAPAAGGVALWELARRANKDRSLGRQVRLQSSQQSY